MSETIRECRFLYCNPKLEGTLCCISEDYRASVKDSYRCLSPFLKCPLSNSSIFDRGHICKFYEPYIQQEHLHIDADTCKFVFDILRYYNGNLIHAEAYINSVIIIQKHGGGYRD
jgi:hypothetical protein